MSKRGKFSAEFTRDAVEQPANQASAGAPRVGTRARTLMELGARCTLDQAKRYSHLSPGHLSESARAIGGHLRLVVNNTGPNLDKAENEDRKTTASS